MRRATLAVDVGGTFTDAVVIARGQLFDAKIPTTPLDQSRGVLAAAGLALEKAVVDPAEVGTFVHGMTVTTNALLTGEFAATALFATRGFTDIEELGRQNRPSLYRLCEAPPVPIVAPERRFEIVERCGPDGVITTLDEESVLTALQACLDRGVEAIAVCLLFSFRYPQHELRVRELAADLTPALHVSLSHETVGTFREYERCATTIADAALGPLLTRYLGRLVERSSEIGLPEPEVMLSTGGTASAAVAARNSSWTVLSGPAGGAVGAARAAVAQGHTHALGFDMGGTSTDVAVIENGAPLVASTRQIAGRPIALPATDIFTVGAGGGSIAWLDSGNALRVGPRSAGARPGPASYGHGGVEPTVTDANLLLGYLSDKSALASGITLDREAAEHAVGRLAELSGMNQVDTATGIVEIANLEMLRATNTMTIARGVDPRDHLLVAFGGAGPMHACAVAESLGIQNLLCPPAAGVLSALGMAVAGRRLDLSRSIVGPIDTIGPREIAGATEELVRRAIDSLGDPEDPTVRAAYDLRYRGQAFELTLERDRPVTTAEGLNTLAADFHARHETRYGFCELDRPVELMTLRVSVVVPAATAETGVGRPREITQTERSAYFDRQKLRVTVFTGGLPEGETIPGPAIIELAQSTVVVRPGWVVKSDQRGSIVLTAVQAGGDRL